MRLSVIVPSLNGYKHLSRCVEALRNQTIPPDEIIIIDSTPEHAAAKLEPIPTVQTHILERPVGVPEMRSIAFRTAKGEVIAMTEDHCVPATNWCENCFSCTKNIRKKLSAALLRMEQLNLFWIGHVTFVNISISCTH